MAFLSSSKVIKQISSIDSINIKKSIVYTLGDDDFDKKVELVKAIENGIETKKNFDKELNNFLTAHAQRVGVKSYLEQMTQNTLTILHEEFDEETEKKKQSKVFLTKRITRGICQDFEKYFQQLKGEKLEAFTSLTASQLAPKMMEEITLVGVEIFLFTLSTATLKEVCQTLGYNGVQANNPNAMVTSILTGSVPAKKEAPPKKVIKFSQKKLALKKGLTFHDIFQHYYVEELQQFCRDKGLKISGNKREVINRILAFLNQGIVDAPKSFVKKVDAAAATTEDDEEEEQEEEQEEEEKEGTAVTDDEAEDVALEPEEVEERPEVVTEKPTPIKKKQTSVSKVVNSPKSSKKSSK